MSLSCPNPKLQDLLAFCLVGPGIVFSYVQDSLSKGLSFTSLSYLSWSWLSPQSLGKSSLECQPDFSEFHFDPSNQVLQFFLVLEHLQCHIIFIYCPDFLVVLCIKVLSSFLVYQYKYALLLCCCAILDKSFPISGAQFSHLYDKMIRLEDLLKSIFQPMSACIRPVVQTISFIGKVQFFSYSPGNLPPPPPPPPSPRSR